MTELIAEIAQAHDGSLGILHSYIDALAGTGVDAIKFQVHIAEAESSEFEPFRVNFSYVDATRFDYWKRMEFSLEQWKEIKDHCEKAGLEFMASPFSVAAVNLLEKLEVKRYKVGSGEITNLLLLEKLAQTGKPVILSTGMSNWAEIDAALHFLHIQQVDTTLLQCTTAYPTPASQWGLSMIPALKNRYGIRIGYSDHSGTPVACLAAAALGAELLEFHAVFDRRMFGPDAKASLEMNEIKFLAEGVKQINSGLAKYSLKDDASAFDSLKVMFGKSLSLNKDLPAGHKISLDDLESKKPGDAGIPAKSFQKVLGAELLAGKKQWEFLQWSDIKS